jgi:hypothetical protein
LAGEVSIDIGAAARVARLIAPVVKNIDPDDFTDSRYYPSSGDDPESVARYFYFMVAIDHRTSRHGPFEGYVDGEFYHGADLLYRLSKKVYAEDPGFFSPERMVKIKLEDVAKWLSTGEASIWDPGIRATLLRDAAQKLLKYYGGRVTNLITASGNRLKKSLSPTGFIQRLRPILPYSDPVEKKAHLLAKFLSRRGILNHQDLWNEEVPVDNHLTRIAIRLGIVQIHGELELKIMKREEVSDEEDLQIRESVRQAYKLIARAANIRPYYLDDYLWLHGRKTCVHGKPKCESCPLRQVCKSYATGNYPEEHVWWGYYY